jgi:hypothetical protein
VNKEQEVQLMKTVEEHDQLLRGNGGEDGVIHSVRELIKDRTERKTLQRTILIGVIALLVERTINYLGILTK